PARPRVRVGPLADAHEAAAEQAVAPPAACDVVVLDAVVPHVRQVGVAHLGEIAVAALQGDAVLLVLGAEAVHQVAALTLDPQAVAVVAAVDGLVAEVAGLLPDDVAAEDAQVGAGAALAEQDRIVGGGR